MKIADLLLDALKKISSKLLVTWEQFHRLLGREAKFSEPRYAYEHIGRDTRHRWTFNDGSFIEAMQGPDIQRGMLAF